MLKNAETSMYIEYWDWQDLLIGLEKDIQLKFAPNSDDEHVFEHGAPNYHFDQVLAFTHIRKQAVEDIHVKSSMTFSHGNIQIWEK